jgi:hypothetical protein
LANQLQTLRLQVGNTECVAVRRSTVHLVGHVTSGIVTYGVSSVSEVSSVCQATTSALCLATCCWTSKSSASLKHDLVTDVCVLTASDHRRGNLKGFFSKLQRAMADPVLLSKVRARLPFVLGTYCIPTVACQQCLHLSANVLYKCEALWSCKDVHAYHR